MYTFWLQHADAVGVAIIMLVALLIGWLWLDFRYQRELRTQRRILRVRHRLEVRAYRARVGSLRLLLLHATQRHGASFETTVTGALALTQPARTPLTDAYLNTTIADVPDPHTPVFYGGGR